MATPQVFTGAMAIVTVGNDPTPIGKMKDISGSESLQRGRVGGLGTILPLEVPVLEWSGSFSCSYYLIDWAVARMAGSIKRRVDSNDNFENYLVLQEQGITVEIFKKVAGALNPDGTPRADRKSFAKIVGAFTNSEGFSLSEGQIGGHNQDFQYINPIIYS